MQDKTSEPPAIFQMCALREYAVCRVLDVVVNPDAVGLKCIVVAILPGFFFFGDLTQAVFFPIRVQKVCLPHLPLPPALPLSAPLSPSLSRIVSHLSTTPLSWPVE